MTEITLSHSLVIMEAIRDDLRTVEQALTSASLDKVEASREGLDNALVAMGNLELIAQNQPTAGDVETLRVELVALSKRIREVRRLALAGELFCRDWNGMARPAGDSYTADGASRDHDTEGALVLEG